MFGARGVCWTFGFAGTFDARARIVSPDDCISMAPGNRQTNRPADGQTGRQTARPRADREAPWLPIMLAAKRAAGPFGPLPDAFIFTTSNHQPQAPAAAGPTRRQRSTPRPAKLSGFARNVSGALTAHLPQFHASALFMPVLPASTLLPRPWLPLARVKYGTKATFNAATQNTFCMPSNPRSLAAVLPAAAPWSPSLPFSPLCFWLVPSGQSSVPMPVPS